MDNQWQKMGVRHLTEETYTKYVYNPPKNGKPWLIFFGRTPYGGPDGDFHSSLILFKRVCCVKEAFGEELNVGFVDTYLDEYVREAFDPEVARVGPAAPFVVFVKDATAFMMP